MTWLRRLLRRTDPDREYQVTVHAYGLSDRQARDLLDRVAEAAHCRDEQLFCVGGYEDEQP